MSSPNLTRFAELVASDPDLARKIQGLSAETPDDAAEKIAALSAAAGCPVAKEDILAQASGAEELSEEQLDLVAGGRGGLGSLLVSAISPGSCTPNYGDRPPL